MLKYNEVKILFWDLDKPQEQPMISNLLVKEKLVEIYGEKVRSLKKEDIVKKYPFVSDKEFSKLEMKEKKLKTYKEKYQRR